MRRDIRLETAPRLRRIGLVAATAASLVALAPSIAVARVKPPRHVPADAIVAAATVPSLAVYDLPGAPTPSLTLANPNQYNGKLVLLVIAVRPDGWTQVLLPVRPNGTTGWIHGGDVVLSTNPYRILVELKKHRVTVYRRTTVTLRTPVGAGKPNTPTPGGGYYLTQLFSPPDPTGPYGPFAYSLSGYSNVLTTFQGGDAIIGLHGTNRPDLLGHDVSSGSIPMANDAITKLSKVLPLGTPVTITA